DCEPSNTSFDRVLEIPYVMLKEKSVIVVGLDPENELHPLYEKGQEITHLLSQQGVIITQGISRELSLKKGDQITLTYGDVSIVTTVLGIQDELGSSKVYVNRSALSMYLSLGLDQTRYNVLYTKHIPEGNYITVIDIEDLVSQSEDLSNMMIIMTTVMTISAISIGVIVLLLIILLAIEQYNYDISLFKVIGYNNKEIKQIFINSYLFYIMIVFFLTLPMALISFEVMMWYMATQYSMIFPMTLSIFQILLSLIITISIFYLSMPIAYKKIDKISLAEALKTYQGVT
ncbi:MAG: hypothetical protein Q8M70_00155, partial [bacterium]|nr:hypothetical protein [bacterium]